MSENKFYEIDGLKYDRVTRCLDYFPDEGLVEWKLRVGKKQANATSKNAKAIGTRVHNIINGIVLGQEPRWTKHDKIETRNCVEGFRRWAAISPQIVQTEKLVYSKQLMLAGTLDCINKEGTIVDFKTSAQISRKMWLQVAMYCFLFFKGPDPAGVVPLGQKLGILRFDKMTSDYEYVETLYDEMLVRVYLGLFGYYKYLTYKGLQQEGGEENGDIVANKEVRERLGIYAPEIRDDWSRWHWEI